MLHNYFKVILRNLVKKKLFTFINVFGLAIGFVTCLLIYLYINNELNFDGFHQQKAQIYRLNEVQSFDGITPQKVALSMFPMGPTLKEEFPEIKTYTRFVSRGNVPINRGDQRIYLDKLYLVDSMLYDIFDFELKYGDKETALKDPNSILITEATAGKFFDQENPIGEQLFFNQDDTTGLKITGVLYDIPAHSHLQFDGLISMGTMGAEGYERNMGNWGGNWLNTYLLLEEGTDIKNLESKFPAYVEKYMREGATEYYQLYLQPLTDIHLGSQEVTHDYQNYAKSDRAYIYIFSLLAIFVLIIAAINFMNLSTAISTSRAREVGVRKTIGANKAQIAGQFIGESVLFSVFAAFLAVLIAELCLPYLNNLIERDIQLDLISNWPLLLTILGIAGLVGIAAGLYPAFFISSFDPVKALKGEILLGRHRVSVQDFLVVVQFAISTGMVIGTTLVLQQLDFIQNKDLGLNKDQVMLLPMDRHVNENYEVFRQEIMQLAGVKDVTASSQRLGNNLHQWGLTVKADTAEISMAPSQVSVDFNFVSFYNIKLLEGREFSKEFASDQGSAFIINQSMAKKMGWDQPIGKGMKLSGNEEMGSVIGLVEDFNFNSLHHKIQPLAMSVQGWGFSEISVRMDAASLSQTIREIEAKWPTTGTDRPFEYEFLDEHYNELYKGDQQAAKIMTIIGVLTILIACLGLLGLATVSIEKRIKEIGIRKVLGASVTNLMVLLSLGITRLVLIAFVIAVPLSYYFMNEWLNGFAYRIEISPWVFVGAGVVSLLIALLTITYRTYKAVSSNPVESLRTE
ncbi:MAG: ABC transporter permease [Bacteroidetes bacterium]|nr:ABC transporter permease [Bacteroidota bacterium]MCB0842292.1 ABC transporter permease [Bacteroidota bacterium]